MNVIDFYISIYLGINKPNDIKENDIYIPNDLIRYIFDYLINDIKEIVIENYLYKKIILSINNNNNNKLNNNKLNNNLINNNLINNNLINNNLYLNNINFNKEKNIIFTIHINDSEKIKNLKFIENLRKKIDKIIENNNLSLIFSHYCCSKKGVCYY